MSSFIIIIIIMQRRNELFCILKHRQHYVVASQVQTSAMINRDRQMGLAQGK